MQIPYHSSPEKAAAIWTALCAKNGITGPAANIGSASVTSMNDAELHETRKSVRLALNKVTDSMKSADLDDNTTDGMLFAGRVIASVNEAFERKADAAQHFGGAAAAPAASASSNSVLRNAADFKKHFAASRFANEDQADIGMSDFLRGVAKLKTTPAVHNALSVGTDTSGGFAVPSRLMPGILSALVPASSLLQAGAGLAMMDEGAKSFTTAAVNAIPTAAWRLEGGALASSEPTFRAIVATPKSLAFQFKISRELLADGVGIEQAINFAIAQAFAKELDRAGLRGTGTNPEPRGILNTVGIQAVSNGPNGGFLNSYTNLFSAAQAILQADAPMPTAAIMSPRSLVKLGALADSTGQSLRVPTMLEQIKLIGTSQVPNALTVGTSTDCSEIYVGDFTNLYFAMRESVSIQMLNELYANTGEIGFACHLRADVVLTYPAAFSVVNGVRP